MTELKPIVVGILYPPEWFGSAPGFDSELAQIEAIDPRIETVVITYVEPHDLRTARGAAVDSTRGAQEPLQGPGISAEDRAQMSRIHIAIAIDLPSDITKIAPHLAWVQAVGAGTAHLQAVGLAEAGVTLTSNGGSNSVGIAEFAFGRLLESVKRFPAIEAAQSEHRWEPLYGSQLSGQTLGLIGYGAINQAIAVRAHAFGMRVLVNRRSTDAAVDPHVDRVYGNDQLHEMLGQCQAVVAAVPETPETVRMMDADALAAMPRGSFFANLGRGTLVEEAALIEALKSGHLASAAIDVATVEPLPPNDPLWDAPNLRISGHCSTVPEALIPNLHQVFRDNLSRFVQSEPLANQVSPGRGY